MCAECAYAVRCSLFAVRCSLFAKDCERGVVCVKRFFVFLEDLL